MYMLKHNLDLKFFRQLNIFRFDPLCHVPFDILSMVDVVQMTIEIQEMTFTDYLYNSFHADPGELEKMR